MTLFGVEEVLPSGNEVSPSGAALREQVNEALAVLSAAVGEDPQTLQARILKLVNHPGPAAATTTICGRSSASSASAPRRARGSTARG